MVEGGRLRRRFRAEARDTAKQAKSDSNRIFQLARKIREGKKGNRKAGGAKEQTWRPE